MALFPIAGSKVYIGDTAPTLGASDLVEADFSAVVWTEIDGLMSLGSLGDNLENVVFDLINRGRQVKQKGQAVADSFEFTVARDGTDAGQAAFVAAAVPSDKDNYPFKVEDPDAPSGGTPTTSYFVGLAMQATRPGGSVNDPLTLQCRVEVNSNIVEVAAAGP